jgi:hypothetical protein
MVGAIYSKKWKTKEMEKGKQVRCSFRELLGHHGPHP